MSERKQLLWKSVLAVAIVSVVVIAAIYVVTEAWRGPQGIPCGSLYGIAGITGTPAVPNPVYHGQQTRINITGYGEAEGHEYDRGYVESIAGTKATLVVNGTSFGTATLGDDSKGYVTYSFPIAGNYSIFFKLNYSQVYCYSKIAVPGNSTSLTVVVK